MSSITTSTNLLQNSAEESTQFIQTSAVEPSKVTMNGNDYVLTFADEFSQPEFSAWTGYGSGGRWSTSIRPTYDDARTIEANNELQYYVDPDMTFFDNPFAVENGELTIKAQELDETQTTLTGGLEYSSGWASTEQTFIFEGGYVEIKAKVPSERGMWSALWLQTSGSGGLPKEIDILEVLGENSAQAIHDTHGDPDGDPGPSWTVIDTSDDFHTYGLLWEEQTITWFIDGEAVLTRDNFVDETMFLNINLAIGGWAQGPDDSTDFTNGLEIDYARIYQPIEQVDAADYVELGTNSPVTDVYYGDNNIDVLGSRWGDTIEGWAIAEIITGNAGDDLIFADAGDDDVYGGSGNDFIDGGDGSDYLFGGDGNDDLDGNNGDDYLYGEHGNDYLTGGDGEDILYGADGDDFLSGGYGQDNLYGYVGDDRLAGGNGDDKLVGGLGEDLIIGGKGDDHLWGGSFGADGAVDTYIYTKDSGADTIYDFENTLDIINLKSFALEQADLDQVITATDGGVRIDLASVGGKEGDSIMIYGLSVEDVHNDMFLL